MRASRYPPDSVLSLFGQAQARASFELLEERLGFLQVLRSEAFGEPPVDRREQIVGVADPPCSRISRRSSSRSAAPRTSPAAAAPSRARRCSCAPRLRIALQRQQPAFDPESFGIVPALFPVRPLDLRDGLFDQIERAVEIAELGHAFGQDGSK